MFEEKLEQESLDLKKRRQFIAKEIRVEEHPFLPKKEIPLTQPSSFPLRTEERGEIASQIFLQQLEEKMEKEKKMFSSFVARPFDPSFKPFRPVSTKTSLTNIDTVLLSSESRALQREKWDQIQKKKREEQEILEQQRKLEQEKKEEEEIRELRKRMVHIPVPIPQPQPFIIKKSQQPLTNPSTPNFKTNKRFANRDL